MLSPELCRLNLADAQQARLFELDARQVGEGVVGAARCGAALRRHCRPQQLLAVLPRLRRSQRAAVSANQDVKRAGSMVSVGCACLDLITH